MLWTGARPCKHLLSSLGRLINGNFSQIDRLMTAVAFSICLCAHTVLVGVVLRQYEACKVSGCR